MGEGLVEKKHSRTCLLLRFVLKGASLVTQTVKHLPAMGETLVRSLGWKDPLEKEVATHSSILAWRIPWRAVVHGVTKSRTRLSDFPLTLFMLKGLGGLGCLQHPFQLYPGPGDTVPVC